MIAKMRGGPLHRQIRTLPDNMTALDVAGYRKPTKKELKKALPLIQGGPWSIPQRGTYSRTYHPFPDGSYAFVWLGWKEERSLTPPF